MKPNLSILTRIMTQPWAVRQDTLRLFARLALQNELPPKSRAQEDRRKASARVSGFCPMNYESMDAMECGSLPDLPSDVTVLMPWGILGRAWSAVETWYLDPVDVDDLTAAIAATPVGSTVVLWFRSPGGIIAGVPESAGLLRSLGKSRRLIAFTDDLCCSAAYWLASQCESIHATPTAELGSIGVYIAIYDYTQWMQQQGIELNLFKAGSMKGTAIDGNPLSPEECAYFQQRVVESYQQFVADVTRNRAITDDNMQGQSLRGKLAASANLMDEQWPNAAAFFAALGKGKV